MISKDLLRQLDRLLPRILWGKAQPSPHQQPSTSHDAPSSKPLEESGEEDSSTGFAYVKRDLVRILGGMAYSDEEVQNRLRVCGGIHVILNLCVVDERNPCMC